MFSFISYYFVKPRRYVITSTALDLAYFRVALLISGRLLDINKKRLTPEASLLSSRRYGGIISMFQCSKQCNRLARLRRRTIALMAIRNRLDIGRYRRQLFRGLPVIDAYSIDI